MNDACIDRMGLEGLVVNNYLHSNIRYEVLENLENLDRAWAISLYIAPFQRPAKYLMIPSLRCICCLVPLSNESSYISSGPSRSKSVLLTALEIVPI